MNFYRNELSDLAAIVRAQGALPQARVERSSAVETCTADKIMAAARRARGEEFVADAPPPLTEWTCTADDIIHAAAKARGEIESPQPKLSDAAQAIAKAIIDARRKRRVEIDIESGPIQTEGYRTSAEAVLAAAELARRGGHPLPGPTGVAAEILKAGEKRRKLST